MIDWRTLMKAPLSAPQYPQNAQNGRAGANIEDIEDIEKRDWCASWRALAALTSGLTAQDPRLPVVMAELDRCDDAYLVGDWAAFHQAADRVRRAMLNGVDHG
jgi:hypothetical protein